MNNLEDIKLFSRLSKIQEGIDLYHYLEKYSNYNYEEFLATDSSKSDIIKGKGLMIQQLLTMLKDADSKLDLMEKEVNVDWS